MTVSVMSNVEENGIFEHPFLVQRLHAGCMQHCNHHDFVNFSGMGIIKDIQVILYVFFVLGYIANHMQVATLQPSCMLHFLA